MMGTRVLHKPYLEKNMSTFLTLEQIDQSVEVIRQRTSYKPRVGIILGSGLNGLADSVQKADLIPFGELPHWPTSTVFGHAGRLVIGELEGQNVFVMQGRIHFYEGYSMSQVTRSEERRVGKECRL